MSLAAMHFFKSMGLPEPVPEYRFHPTRKWRMDFAWPEHRIALEVEGGVWTGGRHTRGAGFKKDMAKYNSAAVRGWRVLRVVPRELLTINTAQLIEAAIEGGPKDSK